MSAQSHTMPSPGLVERILRWWNHWTSGNVTELDRLGGVETERVAHDAGVTSSELRVLAGRWPDAAELLTRRAAELGLDEGYLREREPVVLQDMQRVCTLCVSKKRCEHDLSSRTSNQDWRTYCPNSDTLTAVAGEERKPAPRKAS